MKAKQLISFTTGLALVASMALAVPAFAQTGPSSQNSQGGPGNSNGQGWHGQGVPNGRGNGLAMKPGVFGTVTAISGSVITVSGHSGFGPNMTATTTFTVNTTSSTVVRKDNATSSVSSIAVGDMILAQGTVSGTTVTATAIRDGVMMGMRGPGGPGMPGMPGHGPGMGSTTPVLGNGQPVIAGTVSAISGTTLTIITSSNVTYTVDASSAKILEGQGNATASISNVASGDKVLIQGAVNGTSVTASTVIDQSSKNPPAPGKPAPHGFMQGIASFFTHLFGF